MSFALPPKEAVDPSSSSNNGEHSGIGDDSHKCSDAKENDPGIVRSEAVLPVPSSKKMMLHRRPQVGMMRLTLSVLRKQVGMMLHRRPQVEMVLMLFAPFHQVEEVLCPTLPKFVDQVLVLRLQIQVEILVCVAMLVRFNRQTQDLVLSLTIVQEVCYLRNDIISDQTLQTLLDVGLSKMKIYFPPHVIMSAYWMSLTLQLLNVILLPWNRPYGENSGILIFPAYLPVYSRTVPMLVKLREKN